MKQFFITMAGVFAGLMIFMVGVPFVLVGIAAGAARPPAVPERAVLELDLREPLTDQDSANPLASLGRRSLSVMSVIETLRQAEGDSRVKALFVRLPESGVEPGAADELRLALKRFSAAGKKVIVHSQGLYPAGMIASTYMVGSAGDELWMQPGASMQVTGVASEDIFFKRFFDKYGIKADFEQRAEFKNAVNPYLYSDYTPAHREATLSWMTSVYTHALGAAAVDRKKDPAELRRALEAGPYISEQAKSLGLIDKVGQVQEAEDAAKAAAGRRSETMEFADYARHRRDDAKDGEKTIAVVEAEGPIMTGKDGASNPFSGSSTVYSDDISEQIYKAAKDKDVKAVVFRVNSPGGSDTASEQILAAVRAAKAAKKPVVVSMGTFGASGGYWISSEASAIVAEPTTLTGSIGVYGGKFAIGDALARHGVDIRQTEVGSPYAGAFGVGQEFSPEERAAFAGWMDRIYANFITRVAKGRNLPEDRVREIARGRVWTGAQAKDLGLVDEVGGFYQAVDKAKALAGLTGEVKLQRMREGSPIEALQKVLGVSGASVRTLAAAAWVLGDPKAQSILDGLVQERLRAQGATVLAPTRLR
jgi:protease-4